LAEGKKNGHLLLVEEKGEGKKIPTTGERSLNEETRPWLAENQQERKRKDKKKDETHPVNRQGKKKAAERSRLKRKKLTAFLPRPHRGGGPSFGKFSAWEEMGGGEGGGARENTRGGGKNRPSKFG